MHVRFRGQQGQAFEPFNLLIGAIMALMMLVIIISAINYFEEKRLEISRQKLDDGLMNAVRQPNGKPLMINGVLLQQNTSIAAKAIAVKTGLKPECIAFEIGEAALITEDASGLLNVKERILVDVIATCTANDPSDCEIGCTLSFQGAG